MKILFGYFYYRGKSSREFDLWLAYREGEDTTRFGIKRETKIETLPNSYKSYDLGTTHEPLILPLKMWTEQLLTRQKRIEICDWLFKDDFGELYMEGCNPEDKDVIYYCKIQGEPERFVAGNGSGYLECNLICDSPFPWSRPQIQPFDLRKRADGTSPQLPDGKFEFQIQNTSNYNNWYDCVFKITIPEKENTDITEIKDLKFTIWNKSNSKKDDKFEISSELGSYPLQYGEVLQIDMVTGNIYSSSSIAGGELYSHRRKNCNKKFIKLSKGINKIEFSGNCHLEVISQFPVLM